MLSLRETFQSLKLEDGQPDLAARKAQLDDLKDHLSYTEIRRLREQLNSVTIHLDIYNHLPADLLTIVVDYLELEDVMIARCVSHRWRHLFSTPELCLQVAQEHLPATWAKYMLALRSSGEDVAKSLFLKCFFVAAVDRVKRLRGCYEMVSTHCYDHDEAPSQDMPRDDWQYQNGRIGYRIHNYGFVTKHLRTGVVRRFFDENRERVSDWLLLEQHIVLAKSARNTVFASPIDSSTSEITHKTQLPHRVSRISGHGRQVGIVTFNGDVFVWNIGGIMKHVKISQISDRLVDSTTSRASVIFHPLNEKQFFVVCEHSNNECRPNGKSIDLISLIVMEYVDWKLYGNYHSDSLAPNCLGNRPLTISGGVIACLVSKSNIKDYRLLQDGIHLSDSQESRRRASSEQVVLTTFDIWKKKFEFLTYFLPPAVGNGFTVDYIRDALFWNSQMLLPLTRTESRGIQTAETTLLLAMGSLKCVGKHKQRAWHGQMDAPITDPVVLRGDDDTVVLFGKETMVVWRFTQTL